MEKTFDFDHFESRLPWGQVKWEPAELEKTFGTQDVLPAWIADMDLKTLPEVQEAIIEAAKNGMYGYTKVTDEGIVSYLRWQQRRNGWNAAADWFRFTPGVVTAINLLLLSETEEGDEVLIQRPVYYPFADSIQQQKRVVVNSPLQLRDGRYEIDFADFERKAASPRCRAFVLSNPHNPVGRVYTEEELRRVGEICRRHHVFVIADEIHSDLIFPGHQHIVFASLGQNYAENCAVCHAPSKTFNLAGLSFSCIMIPNEERRKRFDQMFARYCRAHPNFFAPVAAKAAWDHGEAWLDSCLAYIQKNDQFVREFAEDTWNGDVKISPLEGTYLQWIDFRRLEPDAEKLRQKMLYQAHVAMDEGSMFGPEGNGFERLNLAAPRNLIEEIMDRIAAVLR